MAEHISSRCAVLTGIDRVQPVGQHADGLIADGQCLTMGADVDAVGQSANDEHLGAQLLQVCQKTSNEVTAVNSATAGAHQVDDMMLIQVSIAYVVQNERCILTFPEP